MSYHNGYVYTCLNLEVDFCLSLKIFVGQLSTLDSDLLRHWHMYWFHYCTYYRDDDSVVDNIVIVTV